MNRERKAGLGILIAVALVALIIVGIFAAHEARSLKYTIVFSDAKGLQVGDRVQLNGFDIGIVKKIELFQNPTRVEVSVRIDPEHADKIRSDSTARIRNISIPNVSGQMIVEIINPESEAPADKMKDGTVVQGLDSMIEYQAWKIKQAFSASKDTWADRMDQLGKSMKDVRDQVKDLATSPQVREALDSLQAFMREMREKGRDAVGQLKEEWPQVREKVEPVLEELKQYGREHIVEQIKLMMRQIEETLQRWSEMLPQPSATPAATPAATPTQI